MTERPKPARVIRLGALGCVGFVVVALIALFAVAETADRWVFSLLDPGEFDPGVTPPAPDYASAAAWAALPDTDDDADVALDELPATDQATAPAAVFYLHPTTWLGSAWNGPIDSPAVVEATAKGGTLIQASAFNACCAVYAPRYRQANGVAFTHPDDQGQAARDIAYADVSAAFDEFLARIGDQPFLVASHSQGSVLATRLLRERVAGSPLEDRLVAAWVVGAPANADDFGLPLCDTPTATGCVAAWNARGPKFRPNALEFEAERPDTITRRACVNPITWRTDGAPAPRTDHAGAVFFDTPNPHIKPAFADAQCIDGALVITEMGDPERDPASDVLLWMMGPENYHPIEYQLFYVDIRHNAVERVDAWFENHPSDEGDRDGHRGEP